jgi:PAS domain S-box-containing protein
MGNDNGLPSTPSKSRCLAEERLPSGNNVIRPSLPVEESQRLIHELQVHQIELEMQNEELRQARDERQQMEVLLGKCSDLDDFAPAGYFNLDRAGIIRAVNLTGAGMLGVERSLLINQRLDLFISDESRPIFHSFLDKIFANETKETCEIMFQKEGHSPLFVQVEAIASEAREECRAVIIDITGRKQTEEALRTAQNEAERYGAEMAALMDAVPAAVFIAHDVECLHMTVNRVTQEMTGLPATANFSKSAPPSERPDNFVLMKNGREIPADQLPVQMAARGQEVRDFEFDRVFADGTIRTMLGNAVPLLDKCGRPTGAIGAFIDITGRKRMEDALRESEQRVRLKLESILTPEGDIGTLNLSDIIDVKAIQPLMDDFFRLAHIPMSLSDLEGNVLVGVGWQKICTRFHRKHPETSRYCIESDTQLSSGIPEGEFRLYKCKNNMWDIVTPIMVGGKHIGNLFMGQFFFDDEQPDYELFRSQAAQYSFNEADYMAALAEVPRWSRLFVETAITYFMKLTSMISQVSYSNIKLARSLAERDALMDSLRKSQQQNEFLADIVRHAAQPFAQTYQDGRLGLINYAFEQLTGYAYDELVAFDWNNAFTPPEWCEFEREKLEELRRTGKPVRYEKEYIRKDGTRVPIELLVHIVTDTEGNPYYYYSFITDITERKRAEEALTTLNEELELRVAERTEELKFNNLILSTQNKTSIDGILVVDEGGTIISYNRRFVELWDIPPELVETKDDAPVLELVASRVADREDFLVRVKFLYDHREEKSREEIILKDGRIFDRYSAPMLGDDGKYFGRVWYFRDITERQVAERALREETIERLRAVEALREKEQMLIQQSRLAAMGEMIGNIAHQWRQPLNNLGLIVQQLPLFYKFGELTKESLDENVMQSMNIIQHMSKTIDDFRNYFRPDKEKVEFKVRETIDNALSLIKDSFKNQQIIIDVIAKNDPIIYGYRNEFAQVLLNILNNARDILTERATANPKVTITIFSEGSRAVVTISDNAGGIPEEIMGKIFDPYFTTKGPQEGTGVGLFMSKTIIEKNMGGKLTGRNITDGAEFRIEV